MKRIGCAAIAAIVGVLLAGAGDAAGRGLGTLQLNGLISFSEQGASAASCSGGTPATTACFPTTGSGVIPGLGQVSERFTLIRDNYETPCNHAHFTGTLSSSKGEIDVSADNPGCVHAQDNYTTFTFTITGGTGAYAGATGSGGIAESYGSNGTGRDTWTGSLTVPTVTFDTAPPTITGAISKTAKTTSKKGVHVRYTPTAMDAIEGAVPVSCSPKSGALFPIGRTTVTCTATDASGNAATTHFTVAVKHARP